MSVVALLIIPFWKKQLLMSVKEEMLHQIIAIKSICIVVMQEYQ